MPQKALVGHLWPDFGILSRSFSSELIVDQVIKLCYALTRTLDDVSQASTILGCLDSIFDNFACGFEDYLQIRDLDANVRYVLSSRLGILTSFTTATS